eukprot:CAMPEP_0177734774 /NCGR_PEP_ID=MMETSP0484_2-20121128/24417_1 /TAXON_ID=354590 /ORGANISM="Rhodomonas lens, Strain RHODO" /LENGTH=94 /DNA_ID=CAMNT_0019248283 /DNA_START=154 /DNA_END=434 /DNA_ORIENTATION=+
MSMPELEDAINAVNRATDRMELDDDDPMDAEPQCDPASDNDDDPDDTLMQTEDAAPSTPRHSTSTADPPDTTERINIARSNSRTHNSREGLLRG